MTESRVELLIASIRRECEMGLAFVAGIDRDAFLASPMIQHAVAMSLVAVGEYAARIAKADPGYFAAHPEIPWISILGMRNRIAHGYFGLDFEIVWDTVTLSIPDLLANLPKAAK